MSKALAPAPASVRGAANLYEALMALKASAVAFSCQPWAATNGHFNENGEIIDDLSTHIGKLADEAIKQLRSLAPKNVFEYEHRAQALLDYMIQCEGIDQDAVAFLAQSAAELKKLRRETKEAANG